MATGSQPLAFAELAVGGLLLASAVTGETVGELLTNGLTPAGKARLHAKGIERAGFGSQIGAESLALAPSETGTLEPGHGAAPGSLPVSPGAAGATVGRNPSGRSLLENRSREVEYGLRQAMKYNDELNRKVAKGELSEKKAAKLYHERFPWAKVWFEELAGLTKALG